MKRTTIFLDEGMERDLRALAAESNQPVASLVREAIGVFLVGRKRKARELSFLAAGRSGRKDVAATHEELLWRDLVPHDDVVPPGKRPGKAKSTRRPRRGRSPSRS